MQFFEDMVVSWLRWWTKEKQIVFERQVSSKDIADIEDIMLSSKRPRKMWSLDEEFNFGNNSDELSFDP